MGELIENFIDGKDEQCLEPIINKTLELVSNIEKQVELTSLASYLKKFNQEGLVNDPAENFNAIQTLIDFSTMFHWKHKGSLYIKTGNSFNAIKFKLKHLDREFELRLETNEESKEEEVARNNNKDTKLKHYKFNRFEEKNGVTRIIFNLSDASTTKADLFKSLFKDVFKNKEKLDNYLFAPDQKGDLKPIFNELRENKRLLNEDIKLTPDKLNDGEKKFVRDFAKYIKDNPAKFKDFDVYLMRNVESLKSIGIYLNDDSAVFYPDFIMWLIAKEKVYINFIDPKGQMGMKDFATEQYKEKVTIADKAANPTLLNIEKELKRIHKKDFVLNSFILLRDKSELGKNQPAQWKKDNMIAKNILRLDWHLEDEKGNPTDKANWVDGKNYLDWTLEMG